MTDASQTDQCTAPLPDTDEVTPGDGVSIPAGMVPWHGGDSAPADWDGGPVLLRDGTLAVVRKSHLYWLHQGQPGKRSWGGGAQLDVMAYTPKVATQSGEALRPSDEAVKLLAHVLEEWDMKDPPNDWTGHAYEDIARDGLRRLASLSTTHPSTAGGSGSMEAVERVWLEIIRDAIASATVMADLADRRAETNEVKYALGGDLAAEWWRYAKHDRERAANFRLVASRLSALASPKTAGDKGEDAPKLEDLNAVLLQERRYWPEGGEGHTAATRCANIVQSVLGATLANTPKDTAKGSGDALRSIVVDLRRSLTNGERNRDNTLSIIHDELRAIVDRARTALSTETSNG